MKIQISKYATTLITAFSILMVVGVAVVVRYGLAAGIEFTGGTLIEMVYSELPEKSAIESSLTSKGLEHVNVRVLELESGERGYVVRTKALSLEEERGVKDTLKAQGAGAREVRTTTIGPTIGAELLQKAWWAIGLVVLIIMTYVAFAFRKIEEPVSGWYYGMVTVAVLLHDVLMPAAVMSILGHYFGYEIDALFITALLAILGYSVNDTVVVFDRVREILLTEKENGAKPAELKSRFVEIVDRATNMSVGRSINTSLTVIIALIALYFFGAEATKMFALMLAIGVFAGTYSSILVANPLIVFLASRKK